MQRNALAGQILVDQHLIEHKLADSVVAQSHG
jgi:hypothetical protein